MKRLLISAIMLAAPIAVSAQHANRPIDGTPASNAASRDDDAQEPTPSTQAPPGSTNVGDNNSRPQASPYYTIHTPWQDHPIVPAWQR